MMIRKKEEVVKSSKPRPDVGQLREWRANETTVWLMKELASKFPDYRGKLPLRHQDQSMMLNYEVGCRTVLEQIEKICNGQD